MSFIATTAALAGVANSAGYLHGAQNWGGVTDVRNTAQQPGFYYELPAYGSYLHSLGAKF
jgi:alpha-galactosidase